MKIISLRKKRAITNQDGALAAPFCTLPCSPIFFADRYRREPFVRDVQFWDDMIGVMKRSDCIQYIRNMGCADILPPDRLQGVHIDTLRAFLSDHCTTPAEREEKAHALAAKLFGEQEERGEGVRADEASGEEAAEETVATDTGDLEIDQGKLFELVVALDSGNFNATRKAYAELGVGPAPGSKADLFEAAERLIEAHG